MKFVFLFSFVILFSSCSYLDALKGNYYYSLGDYNKALIEYTKAEKEAKNLAPWISYNISLTYKQMGELNSTFLSLEDFENTKNKDLSFHIYYLKGIIYYVLAEYVKSKEYLLKAIYIKPQNLRLKKDLELCIKKLKNLSMQIENNKRKKNQESSTNTQNNILDNIGKKDVLITILKDEKNQKVSELENDW